MRSAPSTPASSAWSRTPVPRPPRARRRRVALDAASGGRRRWRCSPRSPRCTRSSTPPPCGRGSGTGWRRRSPRGWGRSSWEATPAWTGACGSGSGRYASLPSRARRWCWRWSGCGSVRDGPRCSPVGSSLAWCRCTPWCFGRARTSRGCERWPGGWSRRPRHASKEGAASPVSAATRLPRLEVQDLRIELVSSKDGRPLDLGAWDAQVEVSAASSGRVLELAVQRDGGGEARTIARWARDQPIQLETVVEAMPLRPAGRAARAAGGSARHRGLGLRAGSTGCSPRTSSAASSKSRAASTACTSRAARLATEPVGPWRLSGAGIVDWDRGSREIRLRDGHIGFGENDSLRVNLEGVYEGVKRPALPRRGPGGPAPLPGRGRRAAAAVQPRRGGASHPRAARCAGAGLRPGARSRELGGST